MTEYSKELVERMVAHFRAIDKKYPKPSTSNDLREVRAIVSLLPASVDPDLVEARQIAAKYAKAGGYDKMAERITNGDYDDSSLWAVPSTLAALKRGRELERSGS